METGYIAFLYHPSHNESKSVPCGTIGCHAGEYLLGRVWGNDNYCSNGYHMTIKGGRMASYTDGMYLMAEDLGFHHIEELIQWAGKNPDIWGNQFGSFMFGCSALAFVPREQAEGMDIHSDADANALVTVTNEYLADWWQAVADRLYELEQKEAKQVAHVMPHPMTQMQPPAAAQARAKRA